MLGVVRLAALLAVIFCAIAPAEAASSPRCVLRAKIDGVVTSGTADYVQDAIAAAGRCEAVLLVVDTPGGALEATRRIVQLILSSPLPVITYVSPSAARAGSAGMFLVIAGHVAAMAPGSNIGAAHPVTGMGGDPDEAGEEMGRKIENDTAAFARAVAQQRERNADWAERAVRESLSATANEAVDLGVVDLVAANEIALFEALDGRPVMLEDRIHHLALDSVAIVDHAMSLTQRVRSVLGNPTLVFILLMIGALGVVMEISSPGMLVPGAIGALALVLAAIGLDLLPVNVGAVVLILAGVGLMIAELFVTSYGALGLSGFALLVVGSLFMIDRADPEFFADPSFRLSWSAVIPLGAVMAATTAALGVRARRVRHQRGMTGAEGLIGAAAIAASEIGPEHGAVRVAGERWRAVSEQPIARGARVSIVDLRGLELVVEPLDTKGTEHAA
jgi:membrane-bound serine protease (ClpP class)